MHEIWACDFLQLYDAWFHPIFAFFIIEIGSRKAVHVGVTRNPTTTWVAQQLRNATSFGEGARFLIRDNDDKFGVDFDRAAAGTGIHVLRTAVGAPRMNAFCERLLGSVRRECLDHVVVLGEGHLESVLGEYCFGYFNEARPHRGSRRSSGSATSRSRGGRPARAWSPPIHAPSVPRRSRRARSKTRALVWQFVCPIHRRGNGVGAEAEARRTLQ
jgi:hypothetical protein